MRIAITKRNMRGSIGVLMILLLLAPMTFSGSSAQLEHTLIIEVYDTDTSNALQTPIVFEGKSYDVAIGTDEEIGFVVNVSISVPWISTPYVTTNESPFITIQAPSWDEYPTFDLRASKEGYTSVIQTLTVMKGALSLRTKSGTVKESQEFQVTVTDQDNQPVRDARVSFDVSGPSVSTDAEGVGYLNAPEVSHSTNFALDVMKEGYVNSSATILVEDVAAVPIFGDIILFQVVPILFAAVAVIFAVLYVRWRKRKHGDVLPAAPMAARPDEKAPNDVPRLQQQAWETQASSHKTERRTPIMSASNSKVEEIRIPLQEKRKETTILPTEEPPEPSPPQHTKWQDDWFKGEEYMRYKLDEMTGSVDRKHEGKWFEGERDIQSKVDEALKKQSKRKKEANNDLK